jgi:hypothetical protein
MPLLHPGLDHLKHVLCYWHHDIVEPLNLLKDLEGVEEERLALDRPVLFKGRELRRMLVKLHCRVPR